MPGSPRSVAGDTTRRARALLLRSLGGPLAVPLERAARRSRRRLGIALVYHRVGDPPGDLRWELLPTLGSALFDAQVGYLAKHYWIVHASELLEAAAARRPGKPFPVAITFDDDLRSHVETAAPILARAGATATFFLTGASLRAPHRFWWERLQDAVDRELDLSSVDLPRADGDIHEVARAIEALPPRELDDVDRALGDLVGRDPDDAGLRAGEVRRLSAAGFEVGFHTRRHRRLPSLTDDALRDAMQEGRRELEDAAGHRLTTISYPHGRADRRVSAAARAAAFQFGFTGDSAVATPESDPLLIGRVGPSYASVGELAFDVARTLVRASSR